MLHRKDYKAVAAIVNRCSGPDSHYSYQTTHTDDLCKDLADYFATDNPRFDRERFLTACGIAA